MQPLAELGPGRGERPWRSARSPAQAAQWFLGSVVADKELRELEEGHVQERHQRQEYGQRPLLAPEDHFYALQPWI
jgi:hypothetical protein